MLHEEEGHGGEGFVHLEDIDVADLHAIVLEDLLGHWHGTGQHDRRLRPDLGGRLDAGAGFQTQLVADFF